MFSPNRSLLKNNTMKILKIFLFTCISIYGIGQSIDRVEPPFWWAGMQDNSLQLLIHGQNIGDLSVNIHGVKLRHVIA